MTKIKATLENSCSKHGYIKRDSIKIIKRSPGHIKESHFNGNIAYDLNCIAEICKVSTEEISIKATTNEKLGFIGREEGIVAYAVVMLVKQ